ncbi:MAG TPA: hypothetical protein VD788_05490 [Candidatus Polarisedimenticolaceae bacterium]|nr:hypothetical protein [Candidatus Polarisedimenticolaceae bacterium]
MRGRVSRIASTAALAWWISGAAIAQTGPSLTLEPASGPAGSIVVASGTGFDAGSCGVELFLDSTGGSSLGTAELVGGAFSREIEIPAGTTEGAHEVIAQGLGLVDSSCSMLTGEEGRASFEVLAAVTGPFVSDAVTPYVQTIDLGDLPIAPGWQPGDPIQVGPGETTDGPQALLSGDPTKTAPAVFSPFFKVRERLRYGLPDFDRLERSGPTRQMLRAAMMTHAKGEPLLNFDGIAATGVIPASPAGDVGPEHFIQTVNAAFAVYDKQGNLLAGPASLGALWSGSGGACEAGNDGDPDVRYDAMDDRWVISSIVAFDTQCLAISRDGDPVSGGWYLYEFPTGDVKNDYPRLAVWPGAYFVGTQRDYPNGGSDVWAFDRAAMLGGLPAVSIRFNDSGLYLLPADIDGGSVPAAPAPGLFVRIGDGAQIGGDDRLEVFEFLADFTNPPASTFGSVGVLAPAPFDRDLCGLGLNTPCVPQPDGAPALDAFTALPMARLQFRVFDDHDALVFNHTVDVDGADHAGVRWYELRRAGGSWSIYQQGTHAPDAGEAGLADDPQRWMASAAMDKNGNLALGYSAAGAALDPGVRFGGRYAADPPSETPREERSFVEGGGSQTHPSGRWGEFSSMTIDPVDDCTFWYTAQYYAEDSEAGWSTRIGTFQLDDVPPEISCPTDAIAECSATGGTPSDDEQLAEFFGGVTASDDCSIETQIANDAPGLFPLGQTDVTFTATDGETNAAECVAVVEVEDTTMPEIVAPPDIEDFECTSPEGASPELGTPQVEDICDADPTVDNDAPSIFPIGTTNVTWTATDQSDNVGSDTQSVEVVDTTPPSLAVWSTPSVLWSPNHKMIDIVVSVEVSDVCDSEVGVKLVSIDSNEPPNGNGDGNTQPDFDHADFGTDDRRFRLRAERKGNGDGRVYTIVYAATDDSGNETLASTTVTVPHDQSGD